MAANIKFNLKQIADLSEDFNRSSKALPAVILKIVRERFKELRRELAPGFARKSGAVRKTFGYRVRRKRNVITGDFGLFAGRRATRSAIIAANVQQHPGAMPRKGAYLWVPIGGNIGAGGAMLTPRDLIASGTGFVRTSGTGKRIAFQRLSDGIVPMFVLKRAINFRQEPVPFGRRVEEGEVPAILEEIPEFVQRVIVARKAAVGAIYSEAVT